MQCRLDFLTWSEAEVNCFLVNIKLSSFFKFSLVCKVKFRVTVDSHHVEFATLLARSVVLLIAVRLLAALTVSDLSDDSTCQ